MKIKTRQDLLHYDYEGLMDLFLKLQEDLNNQGGSLCDRVLNQNSFYNGHGQLEIKNKISLEYISGLLEELQERAIETERPHQNMFYLKLFREDNGQHTGGIYQCDGLGTEDRLWVSFDNIILGATDEK